MTPLLPTYQTPASFYPLLLLFHIFPIHAPITLWFLDAPFGKFAVTSNLNVPGNAAWVAMELVAPITFYLSLPALSPRAAILAGLYFVHYAHRALIDPLFLSAKRAPLHIIVISAGVFFNLLNASIMAASLKSFPPPGGWRFVVGVGLWAVGFVGNVYHDEILHDLRRPASKRLVSSPKDDGPSDKGGRYRVPMGGLFSLVSFPNYLCEWVEWTGFALAATPGVLVAVPPLSALPSSGWKDAAELCGGAWPSVLLAAPWAFVLAEVTSMLPRALRGHAWYQRTFEAFPSQRRAAIPWIL